MTRQRFDAVIIGAGAGGAAAAWRLTREGLKVLILEAGPWFDPDTDYSLDQPGWERRPFPHKPNSRGKVLYGDLGKLNTADADLASWNRVEGRHEPGPLRTPSRSGYAHVQGVGGSTLHYVGEAHRLHPKSFSLQTDHATGADWPLGYADLEAHYQTCETLIGVTGPESQGARWRSAPFPLPPHPLSPASERLLAAAARSGMEWQANSRAALSAAYDDRPACNYCGQCSRGCPLRDKGSVDQTFLRHALKTGLLTIIANAPVRKILSGASGRIKAVEYLSENDPVLQETPIAILAAGAVQTPRLLLANQGRDMPSGLANGSGQVGRNFMETLTWSSAALLPGLTNSHMGLPADAICWTYNAPDATAGAIGGCRFTSAVHEVGLNGPIGYATRLIPGFGTDFKQQMRDQFGSAIVVAATGAVLPDERSHIALSPDQKDENGLPLPVIHSVLTQNSISLLHFMAKTARSMLSEIGVTEFAEENSSWDRFTATHVFGTARMGNDSADSVTNPWGRTHDHANLWIADASLFPASGGGEAPSLTIQALALRAAEKILE